jgi:hypothetical protein
MIKTRSERTEAPFLPATAAGKGLGDLPLGSAQSRAAARALLERRLAGRNRLDIVSSIPRPGGNGAIHIGAWSEAADGTLMRFCNIPAGMTLEEAEGIVAGQRPTTRRL